jgi:hypothetical protein
MSVLQKQPGAIDIGVRGEFGGDGESFGWQSSQASGEIHPR